MSNIELMESRPAYVKFERRPVQDKAASEAAGRYIAKDVDYVLITPLYTKDVMIHKVSDWMKKLESDVANERIPKQWADAYRKGYEAWKSGEELPLNGTPIKGWGVLSPAQQEMLIRMSVLTVEDLAAINDDGIRRIGMGGVDLKNKAVAFIKSGNDTGKLVMENANMRAQLGVAVQTIEGLTKSLEELSEEVQRLNRQSPAVPRETEDAAPASLDIDDMLPEDPEPPKRGKPAKG